MNRPIVPRFEPEHILAVANAKWRGDVEKVATTSLPGLDFEGVVLSSRYDKADEYETMLDMIEGVSPSMRSKISSIFCDSKAGLCFSVELKPCSIKEAKYILRQLDGACMESAKWHNGIFVNGTAGGTLYQAADFDLEE